MNFRRISSINLW